MLVPSFVGARAVFDHIFTEFTVPNSAGTGGIDTVYGNQDDDIVFGGIAGDAEGAWDRRPRGLLTLGCR